MNNNYLWHAFVTQIVPLQIFLIVFMIVGASIIIYFYKRVDLSNFYFASCIASLFIYFTVIMLGLAFLCNKAQKLHKSVGNESSVVINIDNSDDDTSKMPAELKYSNVKNKDGKFYVDKVLLAETAKNGQLIPRSKAGQAMITMAQYLNHKHVLKTCTGLKINVQASGTKVRYFSTSGKKIAVVQANDNKRVHVTNKQF